ncbi:MAG: hypothetical protein AAFY71_09585 [Bacteroidota bacterium]
MSTNENPNLPKVEDSPFEEFLPQKTSFIENFVWMKISFWLSMIFFVLTVVSFFIDLSSYFNPFWLVMHLFFIWILIKSFVALKKIHKEEFKETKVLTLTRLIGMIMMLCYWGWGLCNTIYDLFFILPSSDILAQGNQVWILIFLIFAIYSLIGAALSYYVIRAIKIMYQVDRMEYEFVDSSLFVK